jgi:phage terminase small subunit
MATQLKSHKQRVFVEEYLASFDKTARGNATKAAGKAGYAHPRQAGSRLLSNDNIQAVISARLDELKMHADEVMLRLADNARFDPLEFAILDGEYVYIDLESLKSANLGHLVKKIYYDKLGHLTVEFHNTQRALELIGQHHKLFTQKHEVEIPDLPPLTESLEKLADRIYGGGSD